MKNTYTDNKNSMDGFKGIGYTVKRRGGPSWRAQSLVAHLGRSREWSQDETLDEGLNLNIWKMALLLSEAQKVEESII